MMDLYSRFLKRFFAAVDRSHNCAGGFTGAEAPKKDKLSQRAPKKISYHKGHLKKISYHKGPLR